MRARPRPTLHDFLTLSNQVLNGEF